MIVPDFASAQAQFETLINQLSSPDHRASEHGEIEKLVAEEGRELLRRLFQGYLDQRAQAEAPKEAVQGSDSEERPHRRKHQQRQLETLFGETTVTRNGYSTKQPGVSGLYPEDGMLNLAVDRYSDGLRQQIALEASKVSFSETSQSIEGRFGVRVGKRQCEELTVKVAQDFSAFYAQRSVDGPESGAD